ncbi:MAG: GGDEF domain-containing protein [Longibaculum sp.]
MLYHKIFLLADKMVATAQSVSDQHLFNSIAMFFIYLIITGGVFAFWYRYKQKQIQQVMYTDKLTGLYNGAAFEIEVQKHSESAMNESVLIYFDLDDFKYLNATYGYLFGNQMLIAIAKSLREFVDGRGSCARNSNDCFFVFTQYHKNVIHDLKTCIIQSIKNEIEFDISDDITFTFGAYRIQKDVSIQDMMENALLAQKMQKQEEKEMLFGMIKIFWIRFIKRD